MTDSLWKFRRRGGNARAFFDPLGWRAHGGGWPYVWLARKFKPGSRINTLAYAGYDRVCNKRLRKWLRD